MNAEHPPVQVRVAEARRVGGQHELQHRQRLHGHEQAGDGADGRKQDALGEQLPRDAPGPAPIAARMPSSRSRVIARDRLRFAMFAHTITSTSATAAIRMSRRERTPPTSHSARE